MTCLRLLRVAPNRTPSNRAMRTNGPDIIIYVLCGSSVSVGGLAALLAVTVRAVKCHGWPEGRTISW